MTKTERKNTEDKFFYQKLQFTNYVQATGEAFSPQKRTSSTKKNDIYQHFSMFVGHFRPPGYRDPLNPDPHPQQSKLLH
jgi:hypothetical protein